jgi:DNA-binding FrmR family transcriptional regulator
MLMAHISKDRKKLLDRVRRLQGQMGALYEVLETKDDCTEVLHLLASCRGSMSSLMHEIVEGHIRFHLMTNESGKNREQQEAAEELIDALRKYLA